MGLPVGATVTHWQTADGLAGLRVAAATAPVDDAAMGESLRRDVRAHPNDFVVFETEAGAERFVAEHQLDAEIETNERLVARGVVGYWQGKTLVVVPWLPVRNFQ